MTRFAALLGVFALFALPLFAQDADVDDKTFLESLLQDKLSAAGRTVEITGFAGALSSRATMQRLTVSDDEGIWLTLEGATLDWTRSALLGGRLEIDALTAERIEIARRPVAVNDGPEPAASDFALPELPVSINIGEISADVVVLGEPVLGVGAELRLEGRGQLEGGAGDAAFTLERIDGKVGRFAVAASYANDTRVLALDLDLNEGPNGIVALLTSLPGGAPLSFALKGTGPIDDYAADLTLATDGAERIGGRVTLNRATPEAPLNFTADLAGDPSPLMAPDYRAFFGQDVHLSLAGRHEASGRIDLQTLDISADALSLAGDAVIGPGGWLERVRLAGQVAAPGGGAVRLPLGGDPTWIDRASLDLTYDATLGDAWQAEIGLDGLSRPDLQLAGVTLSAKGTVTPALDGALPSFGGHVDLSATGLVGATDSAAAALGPDLTGSFDIARTSGARLELDNLTLQGADYRLSGDVAFDTDVEKLDLIAAGAIALSADDLARFAALSGQTLTGSARLQIDGTAALPGGPFDVEVTGSARDLALGIDEVDRLLTGASTLEFSAARTAEGTEIERFDIRAPGARATGSGWLAETGSRIALRLDLPDAALVAQGLDGALAVQARAQQTGVDWDLALEASAPGGASVRFTGLAATKPGGIASIGRVEGDLTASIDRLAAYSGLAGRALAGRATFTGTGSFNPGRGSFALEGKGSGQDLSFDLGSVDRLTTGASTLSFAVRRNKNAVFIVDQFSLATPELTLNANGRAADEMPQITFEGRLRDLGPFVPGLPGAFDLAGTARLYENGWRVQMNGDGPGGTTIRASGRIADDGTTAELAFKGLAPLALVNESIAPRALSGMAAFDLRLDGPFAIGSLSGTVKTEDARAALPTFGLALDPLAVTARLAAGQATLDARARISTGGRLFVRGPVALTAPFPANLEVELRNVDLRDERTYDLTLGGNLSLAGPLTGGANVTGGLQLSQVELRIPETGFGVDGSLEGLQHIGLPAEVRATQTRAGLRGTGAGAGGGGPVYGLGITIEAPAAVFVRGRGLDAELGGMLTIGGTTQDVITTGGVKLIRGRLDFLGNRLALTEGSATLRGSLDPTLNLVAETQVDDVTVRVTVDGLASDPTVTFSSSPDLPEDEILARLVFGRGLDQISAFQALKLASAVATLSGKGGAGTIGRLREGFGLDDLDVTTDADGNLEVRAGTYISENVYTDVTVGADGKAEINLNLTVTPEITARGTVGSDGSTGIGVYFEKDY